MKKSISLAIAGVISAGALLTASSAMAQPEIDLSVIFGFPASPPVVYRVEEPRYYPQVVRYEPRRVEYREERREWRHHHHRDRDYDYNRRHDHDNDRGRHWRD